MIEEIKILKTVLDFANSLKEFFSSIKFIGKNSRWLGPVFIILFFAALIDFAVRPKFYYQVLPSEIFIFWLIITIAVGLIIFLLIFPYLLELSAYTIYAFIMLSKLFLSLFKRKNKQAPSPVAVEVEIGTEKEAISIARGGEVKHYTISEERFKSLQNLAEELEKKEEPNLNKHE